MSKSRDTYAPEPQMETNDTQSSMNRREGGFTDVDVASRAYERWQRRGMPQGSSDEDWFEAERELQSRETGAPA
jgi:hypothetical protein